MIPLLTFLIAAMTAPTVEAAVQPNPLDDIKNLYHNTPEEVYNRWVSECQYLVRKHYHYTNKDGTLQRRSYEPYCEYLVAYHCHLEAEGVRKYDVAIKAGDTKTAKKYKRASGYGEQWYYSLIYGAANFELQCYKTAPGHCAGPMDVKHYPLVLDPKKNIRWHTEEMWGFWLKGVTGRDLCEHVMLPARPHDWGGGKFANTDSMFLRSLKELGSPTGRP